MRKRKLLEKIKEGNFFYKTLKIDIVKNFDSKGYKEYTEDLDLISFRKKTKQYSLKADYFWTLDILLLTLEAEEFKCQYELKDFYASEMQNIEKLEGLLEKSFKVMSKI